MMCRTDMWVEVPEGWSYALFPPRVDTKRMRKYVKAIEELMTSECGPNELGVLQLLEEFEGDADMYIGVWSHLQPWMKAHIRDWTGQLEATGEHGAR